MIKYFLFKIKSARKFIVNYRFMLLKMLFTKDEKYLIIRAIEDRIDEIEMKAINERNADGYIITLETSEYFKLKRVFSTSYWN